MKLLCISTAEQGGSLAAVEDGRLVCETYWDLRVTHSRLLLNRIEELIGALPGIQLEDMDGFAAAKGPGSFTGLRIGVSVIKALAFAMGRPAFGASSLDGIGFRFSHASMPVCVMMDARRNEVYTAVYRFKNGALVSKSPEAVTAPGEVIAGLDGPVLFAGSGSKAYQTLISERKDQSVFSSAWQDYVSAAALIESMDVFGGAVRPADYPLDPVYLRKSDAEIHAAAR